LIPLRAYPRASIMPYVTVALILLNGIAFLYTGTLSTSARQDDVRWIDAGPWVERFPDAVPPAPGFNPVLYRRLAGGEGLQYPVTQRDHFYVSYGIIPAELWAGEDLPPTVPVPVWVTLLTSMFLHGGLLHLLGNMLYLWVFGERVEEAMGSSKFLLFYLLSGVVAALAQAVVHPSATVPMVGASGAIAGVMGAYLVLFPWSRVLTVVPFFFLLHLVEVPAIIILGLWFVIQFFSGIVDLSMMGGVAWFAHLGGFLAGALLVFVFKRRGLVPGLVRWIQWRRMYRSW